MRTDLSWTAETHVIVDWEGHDGAARGAATDGILRIMTGISSQGGKGKSGSRSVDSGLPNHREAQKWQPGRD